MKYLVFLILSLIYSNANAWQSNITETFQLGDGDSRITAKAHAIELIRTKASSQAKSYIQTTTKIQNKEITESIKVITASLVEITNIKDRLIQDGSRNGSLQVSALVRVDDSQLEDRVKALVNDSHRQTLIARLHRENDRLRDLLFESYASQDKVSMQSLPKVIQLQEKRLRALDKNLSIASDAFSRGTISQMASQSDAKLERIKTKIETGVINVILGTPVKVSLVGSKDTGEEIDVALDLDWEIPLTQIFEVLDSDIRVTQGSNHVLISDENHKGSRPRLPFAEEIYSWLSRKYAAIEVTVAGEALEVPIFYMTRDFYSGRKCGVNPDHVGSDALTGRGYDSICIVNPGNSGFSGTKNLSSPVSLTLSREQALSATSVSAKIVLSEF